jgi:hypothetical protein
MNTQMNFSAKEIFHWLHTATTTQVYHAHELLHELLRYTKAPSVSSLHLFVETTP